MKPATPDPAELLPRLQRQLILAQVRIMELEDARTELAAQLARLDRLLTETQVIAQDRIGERDHLLRLQAELDKVLSQLNRELAEARDSGQQWQARATDTAKALAQGAGEIAEQQARIAGLEAQGQDLRASRSWRWTAWLRTVEAWFRRSPRA